VSAARREVKQVSKALELMSVAHGSDEDSSFAVAASGPHIDRQTPLPATGAGSDG
jgi:hypothetical protein